MRAKTIFIIVVTILVTVILMKNMDEVNFWIFGMYTVPKLAVLGTMFFIGAIVGFLLGRPRKRQPAQNDQPGTTFEINKPLDQADEDYIR